jgi:TatA/E family protein of Tat protein translocase
MLPFNIGPGELILFLIIALVVLGPGKLPDVAQSLGKSVREFRKAATDISDAGKLDVPPPSAQAAPPPPPLQADAVPSTSEATAGPPAGASSAAAATSPAAAPTPAAAPAVAAAPDAAPRSDPDAEAVPAGSPARDPNLS